MVVDRRRRQATCNQNLLPGAHIARQAGRDQVAAVRLDEVGVEAVEVEGDLAGHGLRADPTDSKGKVAVDPGSKAVRNALRRSQILS